MAGEPISFMASFPAIQSAIKITGDGNGMRIQLDVPEIDILQALHVIAMRQQAFKVTIEPLINEVVSDIMIRENGWTAATRDGKLSAHYEHTIAITDKGAEILSSL